VNRLRAAVVLALVATLACVGREREQEGATEQGREPSIAERSVTLSAAARRAAGIRVASVAERRVPLRLTLPGTLHPDPQRSVTVGARSGGRILRVLVDVGSRVAEGQLLARLEGAEVTAALARYRTADARAGAARASLARAERLLAIRGISRGERDAREAEATAAAAEAEAARQDLRRLGLDPEGADAAAHLAELRITSPLAGTVLERTTSPGQLVEKEAPLFVVADLGHLWAVLEVYEKDIGRLAPAGEVEIRCDAYPDAVFAGRLALVEPTVEPGSRLGHARVVLDNRDGRLRPGLTVMARVPLRGSAPAVLTLPAGAVQSFQGIAAVFVEAKDGRFALRPVETGAESEGLVEVRRGLTEGERVVVGGAFVLKAELLKAGLREEDEER
jgi:cobalt-zinc-cadmium efflux system membrane fusion protein